MAVAVAVTVRVAVTVLVLAARGVELVQATPPSASDETATTVLNRATLMTTSSSSRDFLRDFIEEDIARGAGVAADADSLLGRRHCATKYTSPVGKQGARNRRIGRLESMVMGSGPPLVMLPGLAPENGRPVGPIRSGEIGTMAHFADQFTVHWLGRPTQLSSGTTFAELAAETAAALREEFAEPVHLLGLSTGGSLALNVAAEHSDTVRRLVIISSGSRLDGHALSTQRAMIRIAATGRTRLTMAAFAWDIVPPWRGRIPAAVTMFVSGPRLYPRARGLRDLHATLVAEESFDLRALPAITAPTLIVNGGRDRFYERSIVDETAELIPGSRLLVFPERGHVTVVSDRRAVGAAKSFLSVRDRDSQTSL